MAKVQRSRWAIKRPNSQSLALVTRGEGCTVLITPPGLVLSDSTELENATAINQEKELQAKFRQVYNIAYAPGKSLLTTAFMLWMSGTSIQIFSIYMTGSGKYTQDTHTDLQTHSYTNCKAAEVQELDHRLLYFAFRHA